MPVQMSSLPSFKMVSPSTVTVASFITPSMWVLLQVAPPMSLFLPKAM
ncbi:MAG: hypothetical protein M1358_19595 [Chloroflexi bacterium]|nr:hypothetical protein [Chloroflexota bacterium]